MYSSRKKRRFILFLESTSGPEFRRCVTEVSTLAYSYAYSVMHIQKLIVINPHRVPKLARPLNLIINLYDFV